MRKVLCLCILLLAVNGAMAQISIIGKVVDGESGAPIPYATIILMTDYSGTVTNSEGAFVIKLTKADDPVEISCLGYNSIEKTISNGETIALVPARIEIGRAVVRPIDNEAILRSVQRSYHSNTPAAPTNYYANIRQFQIFDDKYTQAVDMIRNVVIPGSRSLRNIPLYEVTAVNASLFRDETVPGISYSIEPILRVYDLPLTVVRYIRRNLDNTSYEITRMYQNNATIYKIDFDITRNGPGRVYDGTIYIDADSYAIVGMKMRQDKSGYSSETIEYNGGQESFKWNAAEFEAGFTKVGGRYVANYLLARDSFFIGHKLASVNYSLVYTASSAAAVAGYPIDLEADLLSQLENGVLKNNTDFNSLLPTNAERAFFDRK